MRLAFGCTAGVGKSTAVAYLKNKYRGVELNFATPLYQVLDHAQTTLGFEKEKDRRFLQWVGTEWARDKNPDIFVNHIRNRILETPRGTNIYVSDVRFENEYEMLKENGFQMVRIIRKVGGTGETGLLVDHPSETELVGKSLIGWNHIIHNSGEMKMLEFELDSIVRCHIPPLLSQEEEERLLQKEMGYGYEE